MRNSHLSVRVRSCVDSRILRHVTPAEGRRLCGEDAQGNTIDGAEAIAVRISRKKEPFRDIRLKAPERAHGSSPTGITASEATLNAMIEVGLAPEASDRLSMLDAVTDKIRAWPTASDNNRAVTVTPGGIIGLTVVPCLA